MDVREVAGEELVTAGRVFELSLGQDFAADGRAAWLGYLEGCRTLGAFVDGRQVATASAFPAELTVPGGATVDVHAVTGVGTLPTHGRRGFARTLLTQQLEEARDAGAVACVLEASEATLYGRYGYGPATTRAIAAIDAAHADFLVPVEVGGHFDYADGSEAVAHFAQPIFEAWRRTRPGQLSRPPQNWAMLLVDVAAWRGGGGELRWVFHVAADGTPDGYVAYRTVERWDQGLAVSEAKVTELVAPDAEVRAALLRFLFDLPLVRWVNVAGVVEDDPLLHRIADRRRLRTVQSDDGLWVRLLDVPAAVEARGWAVDGHLVLEVVDDLLEGVGGRWRIEVDGGRAKAVPTEDAPELTCGIAELGMLWLGGVTAHSLAGAGRVTASSDEALRRASLLLRGEVQPVHVGEF